MGKRLYKATIHAEYRELGKLRAEAMLTGYTSLLQKDFGEALDCTITCLAMKYGRQHYDAIEAFARDYGYDGERKGTNPTRIRLIETDILVYLRKPGRCRNRYGKGVCWDFSAVKALIDKGRPVLLNLWNDGRGYYHDHSVLIVGYEAYEKHRFLRIYDCWSTGVSLIDYDKLSTISSINYVEG